MVMLTPNPWCETTNVGEHRDQPPSYIPYLHSKFTKFSIYKPTPHTHTSSLMTVPVFRHNDPWSNTYLNWRTCGGADSNTAPLNMTGYVCWLSGYVMKHWKQQTPWHNNTAQYAARLLHIQEVLDSNVRPATLSADFVAFIQFSEKIPGLYLKQATTTLFHVFYNYD
jgi:hypothetical protein